MMVAVPYIVSSLELRQFQAVWFLLGWMYTLWWDWSGYLLFLVMYMYVSIRHVTVKFVTVTNITIRICVHYQFSSIFSVYCFSFGIRSHVFWTVCVETGNMGSTNTVHLLKQQWIEELLSLH